MVVCRNFRVIWLTRAGFIVGTWPLTFLARLMVVSRRHGHGTAPMFQLLWPGSHVRCCELPLYLAIGRLTPPPQKKSCLMSLVKSPMSIVRVSVNLILE
jgi:hypothetical protein